MDFRQLQYLVAVAEHRSITHAAEALYISQSALSHYVKGAEDELGVTLFDRSTTPISLTYAGTRYIESARRILLENDRLAKELRDITQHMSGRLTVGTSRDRASYMMPYLLPPFTAQYPDIELKVYTDSGRNLLDALRQGSVDFVLLPDGLQDRVQGLCSEPIYREELILAAKEGVIPDSARMEGHRAILPSALSGMPLFLMDPAHTMRAFCDGYFKRNGIRPEIKMEFSSNISCYRMASTGMGAAIIPFLTTKLTLCDKPMELFSLGSVPETWTVQLYYRKGAYLGQPELNFLRMAREAFSNEMIR